MNQFRIFGHITEDIVRMEIMESHSEILRDSNAVVNERDVSAMNSIYDDLLESAMELYRDTQERRRSYNTAVRTARHQNRLAEQRERSRQTVNIIEEAEPHNIEPIRAIHIIGLTKLKSKALKQSELDAQMEDSCGICLEVNTRANSIVTCCGHGFCKACYTQLIDSVRVRPSQLERVLKCPTCRKIGPKCTEFRARKAPVRKPREIAVEVDELADIMSGITI